MWTKNLSDDLTVEELREIRRALYFYASNKPDISKDEARLLSILAQKVLYE
ncbi:hypothetical protein [Paenibacillus jilunlii]|uniref:Uncharacterized protein n=1 Tax=Paenibacillus jilunlii TaxID=682956 RepID=A0A1G9JB37_9BACL|nr:hypothetical protein [Paenibacillus jilunlii]SDL34413.1 hypothetical protein SAMN05216191_102397 [Paenibacillus jilunlii]